MVDGQMLPLFLACATQEAAVAGPMTPAAAIEFEDGPLVADTAALREWLEAGGDRLVLVPVRVQVDALGITAAHLGELPVRLDDSALGVALLDRVRQACPAASCTVLLEARWGALVGGAGADTLAVMRFVGAADSSVVRARGAR